MEYSPPPLFKQGASARAKVFFFALIAVVLLVTDARMKTLPMIRQGVGIILYPLQTAALMPRDAAYAVGGYFSSLSRLQKENEQLKRERVANGQALQQGQYLMAENAQLRTLLAAAERLSVKSVMSEILYDTRDAFTRKIVVDRGSNHGIAAGQPVIDDIGVVGQVTRVFPFTSEVTLLTDKEFAIPVQVIRSGVRSIAYGRGQSGALDLRFMPTNTDIRKGDMLVTTGIDGVYPPGLSVASVTQVESKASDTFATITCQPSAGIGRNKQLLILTPGAEVARHPQSEGAAGAKNENSSVKPVPEGGKGPEKTVAIPPAKPAGQIVPAQGASAATAPVKTPLSPAPKPAAAAPALPVKPGPAQTPPKPAQALRAPAGAATPVRPAPKPAAPVQAVPKPAVPARSAAVQAVPGQAVPKQNEQLP